ncbi:hypothetical protein NDU88_001868 [Pleurodeles waltl]|uniref:Uncharacterized protein n=1 Tax=Pleurodeles waltl TaxID=8319 RepID=A0AAV7VXN0_PLEWA|nr:hypothetical protein NDU88_001868 [Pleurodeles waltl]
MRLGFGAEKKHTGEMDLALPPRYQAATTEEGTDTSSFLRAILPKMTDIVFDSPLEFQRAHQLGRKRKDETSKPCPIIAYLLRHEQACQLLLVARAHGPPKHKTTRFA